MKLFLISQSINNEYDTYDSAVVAAKCEQDAKNTHPNGALWADETWEPYGGYSWVTPDAVKVELIGTAKAGTKAGVICASFNAG